MTSAPDDALGKRPRSDKIRGFVIVLVAFTASLAISWRAREQAVVVVEPPAAPSGEGIVGFPNSVDPIAALTRAWELTERDRLMGVVMEGVSSDGTVDLKQPGGRVRYHFESAKGEGPQPPRPPGTLAKKAYCGRQNVQLTERGMGADPDQPSRSCRNKEKAPLPEPRCGAKEVWKHALGKGIPGGQRARIEYYRAKAGPAWRFSLQGAGHRFSLYGDCGSEIEGNEAFGSVP